MCKNFLSLDISLEIGFFICENSNINKLIKVISTTYVGNGSSRRTIAISNFIVYLVFVKESISTNVYGGDGGTNSFTIDGVSNKNNITYYALLIGMQN